MADSIEDIKTETDDRASKAQSVVNDGVSITRDSLTDRIAYEEHRANQAAARSKGIGIRFFGLKMPGAGGREC